MSPPIFNPNGPEVSEIVLPNGATASEVIDPDGNVVFEAGPDIPDSGVSRWTFDDDDTSSGNALDVWSNNDGSISGATTGVSGANQTYTTNEAYSFDGGNYVGLGKLLSTIDVNSSFSVSMWFKTDGQHFGGLFSQYNSSSNRIFLFVESSEVALSLNDGSVTTDSGGYSDNDWEHVVGTNDGSTNPNIYLNGSSISGGSVSRVPAGGSETLIGAKQTSFDLFDGDIDDPRVYDKELTSTEVSNLYNTGSIGG